MDNIEQSEKDKIIILIMGNHSGAGKSTLEKQLIAHSPNFFRKVISSTTRAKRESEIDGEDYYFITNKQYDATDFIQTTEFAGNRYGSAVSEYQTTHKFPVICIVPSSAKIFTRTIAERFPRWSTFNIYFEISQERLIKNMRKRGDTEEMIKERISLDNQSKQFEESGLVPNIIVTDSDLDNKKYVDWVISEIICYNECHQIRLNASENWNISNEKTTYKIA